MSWSGVWDQNPEFIEACRNHTLPSDPADYVVPRREGRTPDDRTSFKPGQANWHKENLPNILYQLNPTYEWLAFKDNKPRNLLDANGEPLREPFPDDPDNPREMKDLPILPDRIGSQEEEWFFEAIRRLDPRVRWVDFTMRMMKEDRPDTNALQWRHSRGWREALGLKAWHLTSERGKSGTALANNRVDSRLSQQQKDQNTTRGLTPGYIDPSIQDKGQFNKNWVEWPKNQTGKDWGLAPKTDFTRRKRKDAKNRNVKLQVPDASSNIQAPSVGQQDTPQGPLAPPTSPAAMETAEPSADLTDKPDENLAASVPDYLKPGFDPHSEENYGYYYPGLKFPPLVNKTSSVNKDTSPNPSLADASTHVNNGQAETIAPPTLIRVSESVQALYPKEGRSRGQNQMSAANAPSRNHTPLSPAAETSRSTPGPNWRINSTSSQRRLQPKAETGKQKTDVVYRQGSFIVATTKAIKRTRDEADLDDGSSVETTESQVTKRVSAVHHGTSSSQSREDPQSTFGGCHNSYSLGSSGEESVPINANNPRVSSSLGHTSAHILGNQVHHHSGQAALQSPWQSVVQVPRRVSEGPSQAQMDRISRDALSQEYLVTQSFHSHPGSPSETVVRGIAQPMYPIARTPMAQVGNDSQLVQPDLAGGSTPPLGRSNDNSEQPSRVTSVSPELVPSLRQASAGSSTVNATRSSWSSESPSTLPTLTCQLSQDQDGDMPVFTGAYEGEDDGLFDIAL